MTNQIYKNLKKLKKLFASGENIIQYLKDRNHDIRSAILISYDMQSGSYIKDYNENRIRKKSYLFSISKILNELGDSNSILEVGVGEATTLANLVKYLNYNPKFIFGFDISWSRIKYATEYCKSLGLTNINLVTGDLFSPPFEENSVDVVYTSHSLEPNGGREKEALEALYKVTKKYLVLFEPIYEFATNATKERMEKLGYVRGLYDAVVELGYDVIKYELIDFSRNDPSANINPTGVIVVRKKLTNLESNKPKYSCPYSQTPLTKKKDHFFSDESLLAYPIIDGIPCLNPENAILATQHETTFNGIF